VHVSLFMGERSLVAGIASLFGERVLYISMLIC
jgi:hypothetical protein